MLKKRVGGLVTALITPFDRSGSVDVEAIAELVSYQVTKGTEGLFACGSTGLGPMLKVEERKAVAEAVVKSAKGVVPVVVQVGCADTESSVELARHAERIGADAVASLTPYYYKPGEAAIVKHFEKVSDSIGIPLFAYNIPQFTGNDISSATVASLASRKVIAGVKDSARDFLHLMEVLRAVPDGFTVMNGTEEYGLFAIMSGAAGIVSGGANAFPELFKTLVDSERRGDIESALKAQRMIQRAKEVVKGGPLSSYYSILSSRGIKCGEPRAPILPLDRVAGKALFTTLKKLGAFPKEA